jgi:RNA polymerase-binding transcription factor DksA
MGADGIGRCTEACPSHDGKRCRVMGVRAPDGHVCEPWAKGIIDELEGEERHRDTWQKRAERFEAERDAALARAEEMDEALDEAQGEIDALALDHARMKQERAAALARAERAEARLRELAGMVMGDGACIDTGGEESDYARFERLCREALADPSVSGRDVGVLGLLGIRS